MLFELRQRIAEIGALMYTRNLTDSAGGNISLRVDDVILMTPRYAGSRYLWRLRPEQVLVLDLSGNRLDGDGEVSREVRVHLKLLTEFYPDGAAVVHGHARNALVFCSLGRPIPSMLSVTDKFGEIQVVEDAPAHSQQLADIIGAAIAKQLERVRKQAAAVLAPRHGVFVFARDLESGFDALERIEVSAYCALMARLIS
ncbi:MAG: class II aldolase/adducin family protein [Anaerolineae bacterium]|nr:class II aldolase/adducin family protein [Anaerolineae bacterium]